MFKTLAAHAAGECLPNSGALMPQAFWAEASFGQLPHQKELLLLPWSTGQSLALCLSTECFEAL